MHRAPLKILKDENVRSRSVQLIARLWPAAEVDSDSEQYECLLRFFDSELSKMNRHPKSFALQDPEKLVQAISTLCATPNLTRDTAIGIVAQLSSSTLSRPNDKDALSRSVERMLAISASIGIHIPRQTWDEFSDPATLVWMDNTTTMQALIRRYFESKKSAASANPSREIDLSVLTMDNLSSSHGYEPIWTNNLAEHLRIDHKSHRVMVYEHKIWLWNHLRFSSQGPGSTNHILPTEVVAEALDTLNLLFPWATDATKTFLRRHRKSFYGLGTCGRETKHDIFLYKCWHQELAELVDITSRPPKGKAQFILNKDGTNSMEFWTFWTAIAFGILAIIGVATGIYSAMYAKLAYDVGILQYQLALAQACSADNATDSLPGFC